MPTGTKYSSDSSVSWISASRRPTLGARQGGGRSQDYRPVDGADGGAREPHAELEVGCERERRDDLVDVLLDALPHLRRPLAGVGGRFHRPQDRAVVEQLLAHQLLAAELEEVHADPVLLRVAARLAPLGFPHPPQDAVAQELVERQRDRYRDQDAQHPSSLS